MADRQRHGRRQDPPDPAWLEQNRQIAMSTLCRRIDATSGRLIDGSVVFSSPAHEEKRLRVQKLLHFLNSDWGSSRLRHHCVPG